MKFTQKEKMKKMKNPNYHNSYGDFPYAYIAMHQYFSSKIEIQKMLK